MIMLNKHPIFNRPEYSWTYTSLHCLYHIYLASKEIMKTVMILIFHYNFILKLRGR